VIIWISACGRENQCDDQWHEYKGGRVMSFPMRMQVRT
jgi:hypothetical protein